MRILVTGLSGFIGQSLATKLADHHDVHGLDADLLDFAAVGEELTKLRPEMIVHLAARTEVERSFYEPVSFSSVNYVGTINVIEKARQLERLRLFVFASTAETYGWQPECEEILRNGTLRTFRPFDEETPQHPNAPYAVAKLACEKYLMYAGRAYDLPWTVLRQSNTYGRTDNDFFVVEQIITQMLRSPDEIHLGEPKPYRSLLHIDDLVDLYARLIEAPDLAAGECFCTGPPNAIQIEALAEKIAAMIGWRGRIHWHRKPKRDGEIYYLDSTHAKAQRVLGWEPRIDLDTGLARTIEAWRERIC
jgi:UDP-glucose 4-epimerase